MRKFSELDILALEPCEEYSEEFLINLWGNRASLSAKEINKLSIPITYRLWVLPQVVPTDVVVDWLDYCIHRIQQPHRFTLRTLELCKVINTNLKEGAPNYSKRDFKYYVQKTIFNIGYDLNLGREQEEPRTLVMNLYLKELIRMNEKSVWG